MTGDSTVNKIVICIIRYFISALLFLTSLGKLLDVPGFVKVLETYQAIPTWAIHFVVVTLILLELRIAEWLLKDRTLMLGAIFSMVLHLIFIFWTLITLFRGLSIPNCGCFGVFFARPLSGWTVFEDLILVIASLVLIFLIIKKDKTRLAYI